MISGAPHYSKSLHGLRGVAAAAVILFHWYQIFPAFSQYVDAIFPEETITNPSAMLGFGWLGVPLFFVLSGFLLGAKVIEQPLGWSSLGRFWMRRFLRIYPAVWLHLSALLLCAPLVSGLVKPEMMESLWLQWSLWINMPPQMKPPISNVMWTLPIELSFYFLLPFVGVLAGYIRWQWILLLALLFTTGWRAFFIQTNELVNYVVLLPYLDMLPGTLFTFMVGFSLNFLRPVAGKRESRVGMLLSLVGLLALLQWQLWLSDVYWTGHWILIIWPPCVAAALGAIVFFAQKPRAQNGWLAHPIMLWLGNISFGLYLWHYPIMRAMKLGVSDIWSTPGMSLLALILAFVIAAPIATLSYQLVERPLMGWGKEKLLRANV